ncbi:flavoprotein [Coprinopsis sp. MPI-PUGE-AT-0042]|nr:flavoprotein [Coprinopsis sp. MPI-PUGE-AT-0042]
MTLPYKVLCLRNSVLPALRLSRPLNLHYQHHCLRNMSTKTIAVLPESELSDGQMKEVSFEDGKVLLSKIGDKIHATSAFCTHYGAPLAKGVLTADGRVYVAACFNVCTGDIEDAPAPMALHSFKAHVADGQIHLLATGQEGGQGKGVVIVGGGSGGFQAIESLREHGYKGPITLLSKETYTPIDRLSSPDPSKIEWRSAADYKIKYGTNIRLGAEVTAVDLSKKVVTLDNGKDSLPYEKLILAPGGTPRRLPIENSGAENVYTLRDISDAQKIDAAAQQGKRAVVIGSSFISMELVAAISKRKLASIDVIGMEEYPFERILGAEGRVTGVVVDGETIPADFVIMGFLKSSGLTIEKDGGVKVDQYLRVKSGSDQQNVYAIGDIAIYPQQNGDETRIEHWNVAGNHGRAVGCTIAGKEQPFVKIPVFWSARELVGRFQPVGCC